MPDSSVSISQQRHDLAAPLMAWLLGGSLALALATDKGFGALLALVLLAALGALRRRNLQALRRQDIAFLALINGYPLLVLCSMAIHGLDDPGLFDNAARFFMCSLVYVALRARPIDLQPVVLGAMAGCGLALCTSLLHLLQAGPAPEPSPGRFVGSENAVVFALLAHSLLLVAVTPVSLAALRERPQRLLLAGVLVMTAVSQLVSQSRMGLVAWLALSLYVLLFDHRLAGGRTATVALLLAAVGASAFLLTTPYFHHLGGTISELYANIGQADQGTSLGQRLALWSTSRELIASQPLIGHGIGQFNDALNRLPDKDMLTPTVLAYRHAHSELLQITVELGFAGLAIFMLSLLALLTLALREAFTADARHLLFGALVSLLFFGLMQTQLAHQKTTLMFALLLTLGFSQGMNRKYGGLIRR